MEFCEISLDDKNSINDLFCKEVNAKKVYCSLTNNLTGETRYYSSKAGNYRLPKGWNINNVTRRSSTIARYPNMFDPHNFSILLNIHWYLFGCLGSQYKIISNEDFETNYLITRTKAIQLSKSLGGGELLDLYLTEIGRTIFKYDF